MKTEGTETDNLGAGWLAKPKKDKDTIKENLFSLIFLGKRLSKIFYIYLPDALSLDIPPRKCPWSRSQVLFTNYSLASNYETKLQTWVLSQVNRNR